jgi:hypothetical protein
MNRDVEDFHRQTDQMNGEEPETHTEHFDKFISKPEWKSYGFGYENVKELVFIPKKMVKDGRITVARLDNDQGFDVTMPLWLAKDKGLVNSK